MSVVLRCPTCGTTQRHEGECEACSEGEVRYFCTNHAEGIWLDEPVCGRCGARFGDAPAKAPVTRAPARATPPAPAPDFRPPGGGRTAERSSSASSRPRRPTRLEREAPPEPDEGLHGTPSLAELLAELAEAHASGRGRHETVEVPDERPETRARGGGFPFAGCLIRIVLLVFLLFAAAVVFLFVLFGGQ